jgi:sarcosine oxidase, subunit beta
MSQRADVIIIGAGSIGLAAAYELGKAGVDVLVIEKNFLAGEASGRNPGGIRQLGRDVNEVPLIIAAVRRWHHLAEELDCDLKLTEDGYLWAACSEEELKLMRDLVTRDAAYGLKETVLNRTEVQELAPAVSSFVVGALYSPTDCIADPFRVAIGYFNAGQRHGVRFLFGTEVTDLRLENNRVRGVITSQGEISANKVIVAAGPWSDRIGRMAGIEIPLTPCPNQFILTEPVPPILPPFLLISGIAVCRQSARGHVYIGNTNAPGGITGFSKVTNYDELGRTITNILKIVPAFRGLNIIRTWAGTIDFTPDDNFIFGAAGEIEGLILACGFSGHGFALTPIIGQLLGELIVAGKTSLPVEAFRLSRFEEGVAEQVQHFAHQHIADV